MCTIWAGNKTIALQKSVGILHLINFIACRALGKSKSNHALRFQAKEVITDVGPVAQQIVHGMRMALILFLCRWVMFLISACWRDSTIARRATDVVTDIEKVMDLIEETCSPFGTLTFCDYDGADRPRSILRG